MEHPGTSNTSATRPAGLTAAEAAERLARFGPNEIADPGKRTIASTLREVLTEPMLLLLVVAALIYLVIGDVAEGLLLSVFALLSIVLLVYQERRSENALAALRAMAAPQAHVIRDGAPATIPARDVVPGDLLAIDEGERIAADALLLTTEALQVDESLLTGESVPVRKRPAAPGETADTDARPGGEDEPSVYSGTLAVAGHGLARVTATGAATRTGAIGLSLSTIEVGRTTLQQSTAKIVRLFGLIALIVCSALVVWYGLAFGDWIEGVLSGIAIAMSLLPEEFPVAMAVFLAIGAWRLSQIKVLARRPAIIETLGATTVLCVDKTGTLTRNRMRVARVSVDRHWVKAERDAVAADARVADLLRTAWFASRHGSFDPMDLAVEAACERTGAVTTDQHADWPLLREYPLNPDLLAFTQVWREPDGDLRVATKGAPEAIARLCGLDEEERTALMAEVEAMATQGLRVLAVAGAHPPGDALPDDPTGFRFEFRGLLGFEDPLRETVPQAMREAMAGGIAVKMITGDYAATATAMARRAGIANPDHVLTGTQLERLGDAETGRAVAETNVFARMMPAQKLRLVGALRDDGEIVAMTGDGVNDAPALKAADIGIAMGQHGTDVARAAAGIVLLNEDFGTIVSGVRMGRRIFENLRKVMIYIAAIHVPIAGLALFPLLMGLPPVLLPMHVVLIEMIIDPMCTIAFESTPEESDIMEHPPRPIDDPLIGGRQLLLGLAQGALLLAACLGGYMALIASGKNAELARTMAFIVLTAGNTGLARVNASRALTVGTLFARGYRMFGAIALLAAAVVTACIAVPALRDLFAFAAPAPQEIALAVGVGIAAVVIVDFFKLLPGVRRIMGRVERPPTVHARAA
ncbi:MAG: cation-translocating P-type ATPase [Roseitalea porphyridii]|jgi:Ca2+-transporting ATPase|uniref:cation-translocating P-type ATPase n=1 Tax=Roseitalea porphyridii TaxID=1852022 RepID=UPI0032EDC87C